MKKIFIIILNLIFTTLVFAQTIRVGLNVSKDERSGRLYGYEYDYFQEVSKFTGWNYKFINGDKSELLEKLKNQDVDIILDYPEYKDNADRKYFIESDRPIMELRSYIFRAAGNRSITAERITSLNRKKVGVVKNSTSEKKLREYKNKTELNFEIIEYNSVTELKDAFYSGKKIIDAFCLSDYFATQFSEINSVVSFEPIQIKVLFNKSSPLFLRDFNMAQIKMEDKDPYILRKLKVKHFEFTNKSTITNLEEFSWIKLNNTIIIGYVNGNYPIIDKDKNGEAIGALPIYMKELLKRLKLDYLTIQYRPYENYAELIEAVKKKHVTAAFPIYGDFYEAEKNGIQKSDDVIDSSMGLLINRSMNPGNVRTIYTSESFGFLDSYIHENLNDFELKPIKFNMNINLKKYLSDDKSAILLSTTTINNLLALTRNRKFRLIPLDNKLSMSFGVNRENVGFLGILDRGIGLMDYNYGNNLLSDISYSTRKYRISDFLRDNLLQTFIIIGIVVFLVIIVFVSYIQTIQKTKKKLELSQAELNKALEVAEVASQAKSNFLNSVSHDIRTPMNAIIGFTTLAEKSIDNKQKVLENLSKIEISSRQLLNLINDVLDMNRIESGKVVLQEKEENLISIVKEMQTIFAADTEKNHFSFNIDVSGIKNPNVICDKLRLNQILMNLLSNAFKFTPEYGRIDFYIVEADSIYNDKRNYMIVVQDTGIGMSKQFQEVLFGVFERENSTTISKIQGSGLGMSITKRLVEMMNGLIQVESEQNVGTKFIVSFDFPVVKENDVNIEKLQKIEQTDNTIRFDGKRILLVEDNVLNQEIAITVLKEYGFTVELAENGAVAVEMMKRSSADEKLHYDLILMDIQMPVMNGYEATKTIRFMDSDYCRGIPILAMTANAFEEDKQDAIMSGMNGHVAKPINLEELIRIIGEFIK